MKNAKSKIKKSVRRIKKLKQKRTTGTYSSSKRKFKLQGKINEKVRATKKRTRTKNRKNESNLKKKIKTISRSKGSQSELAKLLLADFNKEFYKVTKEKKIITSFLYKNKDGSPRRTERIIYRVQIPEKEQIDLFGYDEGDSLYIYELLEPYLFMLLKKIRKPREFFSLHLEYFDGDELDYVSTEYKETEPRPEQQKDALLELIEELIFNSKKYMNDIPMFIITGLQIRFYKDLE